MEAVDIRPQATTDSDRLLITLLLAGLFHLIVILGVTFVPDDLAGPGAVPSIEVMLVNDSGLERERAEGTETGTLYWKFQPRTSALIPARNPKAPPGLWTWVMSKNPVMTGTLLPSGSLARTNAFVIRSSSRT